MSDNKFETTNRGFKIYGKLIDSHGSSIRIQESSIVGRPCAHVFSNNEDSRFDYPPPHLTVDQAKQLISSLEKFIGDAESPDNWRNDPEYKNMWG